MLCLSGKFEFSDVSASRIVDATSQTSRHTPSGLEASFASHCWQMLLYGFRNRGNILTPCCVFLWLLRSRQCSCARFVSAPKSMASFLVCSVFPRANPSVLQHIVSITCLLVSQAYPSKYDIFAFSENNFMTSMGACGDHEHSRHRCLLDFGTSLLYGHIEMICTVYGQTVEKSTKMTNEQSC